MPIGRSTHCSSTTRQSATRAVVALGFAAVSLGACKAAEQPQASVQAESLPLTATAVAPASTAPFDQSRLCIFADNDEASRCRDGVIGFFRPSRWGNEQLPLMMAALHCDFSHPVVYNDGGVVCVFSSLRAPAPEAPRGAQ